MKYVSIDLETTGLDPVNNDILEFGAVLDDLSDPKPIKDLPKFHAYICKDEYRGQPYALSMHPTILRRIAKREEGFNYLYPNSLGKVFQKFLLENGYNLEEGRLVRINVAGKNFATFDMQFIKNQTNFLNSVRISHKILDPGILCLEKGDQSVPSLGECLRRIGVNKEVAHNTIDDAIDVVLVLREKLGSTFRD